MEKWQLETAERLASIESSIKYIETNLSKLHPSSFCVEKHKELEKRLDALEDFKKYILIRIAWVSGAFAVLASGVWSFADQVKMFFKTH